MRNSLHSLLKKLQPVSLEDLSDKSFMLFGSGGFAKKIYEQFPDNVAAFIDYENTAVNRNFGRELETRLPKAAEGIIVLGTGNGSYQYNQCLALSEFSHHNITQVILVDPYLPKRNVFTKSKKKLLILEHADGVERHSHHLSGLKQYFTDRNVATVSICPLTLYFYEHLWDAQNILVWGGQKPLYSVVKEIFSERKLTYVEYGFFPQSEFYYLDGIGVNQDSSLMHDNLNWISEEHLGKLALIRQNFLGSFKRRKEEYVLVPLQVPDDANVLNCSRFCNGMQEFIDYIIDYYPKDQVIMFKPHPKDPFKETYEYKDKQVSSKSFLELLECAQWVHGITSSCLYEAALAGIKVKTEGESILSFHLGQVDKLLAAMADRQIPVNQSDISPWLSKHTNFDLESF